MKLPFITLLLSAACCFAALPPPDHAPPPAAQGWHDVPNVKAASWTDDGQAADRCFQDFDAGVVYTITVDAHDVLSLASIAHAVLDAPHVAVSDPRHVMPEAIPDRRNPWLWCDSDRDRFLHPWNVTYSWIVHPAQPPQ